MGSLLSNTRLSISANLLKKHNTKGDAGEKFVASLLLRVLSAEVRWSSRLEDGNKWDIIVSYRVPDTKELILATIQVKTGPSFAKMKMNGELTLYKNTLDNIYRQHTDNILAWVDLRSSKVFLYVLKHKPKGALKLRYPLELDPTLPFLITPHILLGRYNRRQGLGISIPSNLGHNFVDIRKNVKTAYRNLDPVMNPLFGIIHFTKLGWQHMFRNGRKKQRKWSSLQVIPYLDRILKLSPDEFYCVKWSLIPAPPGFVKKQVEVVLNYKRALIDNIERKIVVRILIEVSFNSAWQSSCVNMLDTNSTIVIKSAYYK
jgi:hypothetical protein